MSDGTFLQSTAWADFQAAVGHTTHRIDDVLVVEQTTPLGCYWYVGRSAPSKDQLSAITEQARSTGALFVRIDPVEELPLTPYPSHLTLSTQPQTTLVLDLQSSTEQLLASFHEKTRYNIRLAERKGVTVEESADPGSQAMDDFLMLMAKTGSHQGIRAHGDGYYRTMLEVLNGSASPSFDKGGSGRISRTHGGNPPQSPFTKGGRTAEISSSVVIAYHNNQPLAANLMLWTSDTTYYLHGASDHSARQLMAPHLLQWACIQRAKERGATAYDFWGIAPSQAERQRSEVRGQGSPHALPFPPYQMDATHPWSGITRFKLGFGGEVVQYPPSVDLVLDASRYRLYQVGRSVRRAFGRVVYRTFSFSPTPRRSS